MKLAPLALLATSLLCATAQAATYTVTNTNDSGAGSLRQALASAGPGDTVAFNIAATPAVIKPMTPLVSNGEVIDATTQPGWSGSPLVTIDFGQSVNGALYYCWAVDGGAVRGLALNRCTSGRALYLTHVVEVSNNYIGTDHTGTILRGNAAGVLVGTGTMQIHDNLISGNSAYGIEFASGSGATVFGNLIGTNAAGDAVIANGIGIFVYGTSQPAYISNNRIAGGSIGIELFNVFSVTIHGNTFGIGTGGEAFGSQTGIHVYNSNTNYITANTIANGGTGVAVEGSSLHNKIASNSIYGNVLGIDLYSGYPQDGPTANDPLDQDSGPNSFQNYPLITSVSSVDGNTILTGTMSSEPNTTYTLEFFVSPACSNTGFGEGKSGFHSISVTTNASGTASFNTNVAIDLATGAAVTATATGPFNDTSEFSDCASVSGHGAFSLSSTTYSTTEGSPATITVQRTLGTVGAASVNYSTSSGTAGVGDFTAASGTLNFADGETSKTFQVTTLNDTVHESSETFTVTLSSPGAGTTLVPPTSSTVAIKDNDPWPSFSIDDVTVTEGNSGLTPATFTVTKSGEADATVTIGYYTSTFTASNSDIIGEYGQVTFAPGETSKTITVSVVGDTFYELAEDFYLSIYAISPVRIIDSLGTGRILNDDVQPQVSVLDASTVEGDSGTQTVQVTLQANQPLFGSVYVYTVPGTAKAGVDYVSFASYVFFSGGPSESIGLTVMSNTTIEADKTFQVKVESYSSVAVGRGTATVTILNDDVGVGPTHLKIAAGSRGRVMINLGSPQPVDRAFTVNTNAPGVLSVPEFVTVPAGSAARSFDVTALKAGHSARVSMTAPAAVFDGEVTTIFVQTYAQASLTFKPASLSLYVGQVATVRASLSGDVEGATIIPLAASDSAILKVPASITIPAGGSATFEVTALKAGPAGITATLPEPYGSATAFLPADVSAVPDVPAIIRVSPTTGPVAGGTQVELTGVHFAPSCALSFGGVPAATTYVSETTLRTTTPPHAAGTVDVLLACNEQAWNFANGFTYVAAAPALSSVTPSFGNVAGGTIVRINGANLESGCGVFFGGVAAHNVTRISASQLSAVAPAHAAASVEVGVTCRNASASLESAFSYSLAEEPAASIYSIDPIYAAPGESVTITGTRFRMNDAVTFDSTGATILFTSGDVHVVRVPELPAGRVAITLKDPNGHLTTTGPIFNILEAVPPQITSASPTTVVAASEVTLTGRGFRPGYVPTIDGQAAPVVALSFTRMTIRVPDTVRLGTFPIVVLNAAGQPASIGPLLTIGREGVAITAINPGCTTTEGGSQVVISGTGFTSGASVSFDGVPATDVAFIDSTNLTATTPEGSAGVVRVLVTNPNGSSGSLSNVFHYVSPFDPDSTCGQRPRAVRH